MTGELLLWAALGVVIAVIIDSAGLNPLTLIDHAVRELRDYITRRLDRCHREE